MVFYQFVNDEVLLEWKLRLEITESYFEKHLFQRRMVASDFYK